MASILIRNATLVNDLSTFHADVLIKGNRIFKIGHSLNYPGSQVIDARNLLLLPGCIDDQVHFREPGLTHKADIYHESKAAVAGGITSFMEMPNTVPNTVTQQLLKAVSPSKKIIEHACKIGRIIKISEEELTKQKL